jgi:hypothetical protein
VTPGYRDAADPTIELLRRRGPALQALGVKMTVEPERVAFEQGRRWRTLVLGTIGTVLAFGALGLFLRWWIDDPTGLCAFSLVGIWASVVLLALVVTTRPLRSVIDRAGGRVLDRGKPAVEIAESAGEVVMERTLHGDAGAATLSIRRGGTSCLLLDIGSAPKAKLGEVAMLAILLSAWLRLRLRDASPGDVRVSLADADRDAGAHALPPPRSVEPVEARRRRRRRQAGGASWDAGDVVAAALEIFQNLPD